MFCVIASYDTVVSHSPCKLRVSIHKNKIEAGNWLSRVGERVRERGRCFHKREASVECSHINGTEPEWDHFRGTGV